CHHRGPPDHSHTSLHTEIEAILYTWQQRNADEQLLRLSQPKMPFFTNNQYAPPFPGSALRLPSVRRISVPASERLAAIIEDSNNRLMARSSWRISAGIYAQAPTSLRLTEGMSGTTIGRSSQDTTVNAPPVYTSVEEPLDGTEDWNAPAEGEKLAELSRRGPEGKGRPGGWGRLCLILLLVALLVFGLAVGLGVGLTVGRHHHNGASSQMSGNSTASAASTFLSDVTAPITQIALPTLRPGDIHPTLSTTRRTSLRSLSQEAFYWTISNTSLHYTTDSTPAAASASGSNPNFSNIPLTYVNSGNTPSLSYTFNFTSVGAVCYYNSTTFSGSIYLSKNATYPSATADVGRGINTLPSGDLSAYVNWPYAVEIEATSPGGDGIPTCYEAATNGQLEM
ncbi:Tat pathway signal sequence, partial [Teratosphaeria destructans]